MTHGPRELSGAVALIEPAVVVSASSAISPSGSVSSRCAKPLPGPAVEVSTLLAPKIRSVAFVVVTAPLLLVALLPVAAPKTSTGAPVSIPLYSKTRTSAAFAGELKVTVTAFASAATMFFA
jgi:hypothetical protein